MFQGERSPLESNPPAGGGTSSSKFKKKGESNKLNGANGKSTVDAENQNLSVSNIVSLV